MRLEQPRSTLALFIVALGLLLPACGSSSSSAGDTASSGGTSGDEASEGEEGEASGRRRRRRRRAESAEELPLDERVAVPGTGASLRPPRGSEPMPVGSGFIHPRRRVQILVIASDGPAPLHAALRSSLEEAATEEVEHDDVEIDGEEVELVVDRQEQGELELERVWTMIRRGDRSVAVLAAYAADSAERQRALMRAVVSSLELDLAVPLDPEVALGYRLGRVEGLEIDRSTSGNLTYLTPGHTIPPSYRDPALHLAAVPIDVPASERADACVEILTQIGPIPEGDGARSAAVSDEEAGLVGCEIQGRMTEPEMLATYAALLWRGDDAFIVYGAIVEADRDPWIERYRAAARSLEPTPR